MFSLYDCIYVELDDDKSIPPVLYSYHVNYDKWNYKEYSPK